MELPYYAVFFQGEDFVINVSVDIMKTVPDDPHGFIVWVWIKYHNYEWLINLEDQTIKYKNGSEKFTKEQKFEFEGKDIREEGKDHFRCIINFPLAKVVAISKNRALRVDFTSEFYKKYGDFKKCYGALISKKHLRYINSLKAII
mgnify:CR=1 FL=1|jgi:hypothetical protein